MLLTFYKSGLTKTKKHRGMTEVEISRFIVMVLWNVILCILGVAFHDPPHTDLSFWENTYSFILMDTKIIADALWTPRLERFTVLNNISSKVRKGK